MNRFTHITRGLTRLFALFAVALAPAWAQVLPVVKGEPVIASPKAAAQAYLLTTEEEMPARRLRLVAPSVRDLRSLDATDSATKRTKIGFGRDVATNVEEGSGSAIAWDIVGEWRIAKLRVQSPGATALRVGLRIGATRQPWELRVAGSDDESKALGPVRLAGPLGQTEIYWTPLTEGDAQVIEIASPAAQPAPWLEIATVSHLAAGPSGNFRKTVGDIGNSESCNIDFTCVPNKSQALVNAANAVVEMLFTGLTGGTYLCTGTLLNDTRAGTQIPYLYSANHCFERDSAPYATTAQMQQVASSLNTFFFFNSIACGINTAQPFVQRFGGATYLYNNLSQDVLFVRLNEWAPAGAFLSGWDPNPLATNTAITVLHHPYGDLKKFTSGIVVGVDALTSPQNSPNGYWRAEYNQGITEPGSSGAGLLTLFSGEYLLRGGLFAGDIFQCTSKQTNGYYVGDDWYSRFDQAYPVLRQWLEATALPDFDVSDLWWNPAENGWGMNLIQHPSGQVFAVWYTYATDSGPLWLVMSGGQWVNSRTFTGKLYRTSGPSYMQLPFDPAAIKLNEVGTLTFNFTDVNNGSFTWVVDGVQGTKVFTRMDF